MLLRPSNVHTAVDLFTFETTVLKTNPLVRFPNSLVGVLLAIAYLRLDLRERLLARPGIRRELLLAWLALLTLLLAARRQVRWELPHKGLYILPFGLLLVALSPGTGMAANLLSYRAPRFPDYSRRDNDVLFLVYLASLAALPHVLERPARRWLKGGQKSRGAPT